jgi:hypothetical protein
MVRISESGATALNYFALRENTYRFGDSKQNAAPV